MRVSYYADSDKMDTYERACCLRGYHIFKDAWKAAVGEELARERETNKRYAVFAHIYYFWAGNFHAFNSRGPRIYVKIKFKNKVFYGTCSSLLCIHV